MYIDISTTSLFGLEAIMKILTYGFVKNGPPSYLRNPWNILDFTIIILSILALSPLSDSLTIFKMFRTVRVFRLIGRNEGLRIGVRALF